MSEKVCIAVTGAGGGVGQSIIKALQWAEYDVVALDSDRLATGLYAADRSYLIPRRSDREFVDKVLEICKAENCRLLFPGLDTELGVLARASTRFISAGVIPIVSSPRVVDISDNKLLTYRTLRDYGVSVPKTVDMSLWESGDGDPLPYPFVLKKRQGGSRSRDVHIIHARRDLDKFVEQGNDASMFIAQEHIDGYEYTCGSVTLNRQCIGVIVMRRTLRDGDTYKCFTVRDEIIEGEVQTLMNALEPFGPCNAQLRVRDGRPYVFEINARCSGTTAARALCGFNEPAMVADYVCHGAMPSFSIKEQALLRYWNELVVSNDSIDALTHNGSLVASKVRRM
ncbi:ATP-grasp domain-containing protein [Haloechinothrix salitolerans]|uniref:ATP-grasp domain-containing protein n=1 Tax=Haloechinothrix salitolerans TaxID=926830 RepID=A0ABW2BZP3_9PSEU